MEAITKEKIGWGIIGPGLIAVEFAEAIRDQVPDGYIAAVGSRSLERAQEFANVYGGKAYGSYEEMLCDPQVDVVYVATPHPFHMEHVIMAAEHGKHILCEKPFAVNLQQTKAMLAAAEKNDVFLMEGLWSRFFPAWRYVRQVLDSGDLGDLVSIDSATCWGGARKNAVRRKGRLFDPVLAGGSLLDAGVYSLASMTVAMGKAVKPKNIYSSMRFTDTGVDSDVDMLLEFEDGFTAHLISSLYRRNFETTIYCENGSIHIPRHRNPTTVTVTRSIWENQGGYRGTETVTREFPFQGHGFQFEAMAVHECLRQGLRYCPQVPHQETLILSEICDTVRRQNGLRYPFE